MSGGSPSARPHETGGPGPRAHLVDLLARERAAYEQGSRRPLPGYAAVIGVYTTLVGGSALLLRRSGRTLPERVSPWDVALLPLATHKLSRLVTKEEVTAPLRAPFTRYEGPAAPAETHEEPRGGPVRRAVGQLLTCPFCLGMWVSTGMTGGLAVAPRATRLAATALAVLAGSDFLHFAYAKADQASRG